MEGTALSAWHNDAGARLIVWRADGAGFSSEFAAVEEVGVGLVVFVGFMVAARVSVCSKCQLAVFDCAVRIYSFLSAKRAS